LASSPEGSHDERRASRTLAPQRILIVDDNRDAADSLHALLGLLGAQVEIANDGPSALDAVPRFQPAAILLDIGLPGMSGYEVARQIRDNPAIAQPVIIALTGWGQPDARRQSRDAGFDHHLIKPLDLAALQKILDSLKSDPTA
jgi:CheY-like chemotaxis protein